MGVRGNPWRLAAGGALLLVVVAVVVGILISRPPGGTGSGQTTASADTTAREAFGGSATGPALPAGAPPSVPPPARDPSLTLSVAEGAAGRLISPGFLGFSFEFDGVRAYTGSNPRRINPVLVQLIRNLTPGQAPVLRIGGDSTDVSYAPARGVRPPAYVDYRLGASWMATTAALAHELDARMIMGLNLAADQPALAAAEARDYLRTIGAGSIDALEIGNEPNVYGKITVYRTVFGTARSSACRSRPARRTTGTRRIAGSSGQSPPRHPTPGSPVRRWRVDRPPVRAPGSSRSPGFSETSRAWRS
jgi:hypothetical protein